MSSSTTNTFAKGIDYDFFAMGIDLFDVKINDVHEVLEVNF